MFHKHSSNQRFQFLIHLQSTIFLDSIGNRLLSNHLVTLGQPCYHSIQLASLWGLFLAYSQSFSTGFDKLLTPAIQRRLTGPCLSVKLHRTFLLRLQPDYLLSTFPISVARSSRHLSSYSLFVKLISIILFFHKFEGKAHVKNNQANCSKTIYE